MVLIHAVLRGGFFDVHMAKTPGPPISRKFTRTWAAVSSRSGQGSEAPWGSHSPFAGRSGEVWQAGAEGGWPGLARPRRLCQGEADPGRLGEGRPLCRARIWAKTRRSRGKKPPGRPFPGKISAERAAFGAKRAAVGRPVGAKSPRKPGSQGENRGFSADISSGRDGFADAFTRAYAYTRAHRRARFRACIGRNGQTGQRRRKCVLFVAVSSPFVRRLLSGLFRPAE